tara:strand:+ start:864 stop:3143 length:2280 start_codon:yes stop_codon:yes gene_type:complete
MSETLKGKCVRTRFQNPDSGFTIGTIEVDGEEHTFKGNVLCKRGENLELKGKWVEDPKWGRQFDVASALTKMDESPAALADLIAKRKEFKGLGKVRARRMVDAAIAASSDGDMATGLREHPDRIAAATGCSVDIVQAAAEVWHKEREHYESLGQLVAQGWTNGQAGTIVYYLGEGAPAMILADPYGLIGKIPRFGFRTVDAVALKIGVKRNDRSRMQAGVAFCLDQIANNGDTWTTREGLLDTAREELRPDTLEAEDLILEALQSLIDVGLVHVDVSPLGTEMVADATVADYEFDVFARLLDRLGTELQPLTLGPRSLEVVTTLNVGQSASLTAALSYRCAVVSGAGGVGKTYLMRGVCTVAEENRLRVGLCAPTGKAARKLKHATGRNASTIHRLLEPKFDERTGQFRFLRDAGNPVDLDLVVVDEVSMCDVKLMRALLHALPDDCRLLLVGDHNQIPPVGAGAILRDLLSARARFPEAVRVLTEIVRQAGELARNTTAILGGVVPPSSKGSVVWQVHKTERGHEEGTAAMAAMIVDMVVTAPEPLQPFGRTLDLDWDVQVLAPMRKGPLGTYRLNVHLQALRQRMLGNPAPEPTEENKAPRPLQGDRVIWTKNDYELDLPNGTQAIVLGFPKGAMQLFTEDGREVIVPAAKRNRVEVAYAMTIHKSQGSEWPFVVLVASSAHWIMHDRNLLYTGASRAAESLMILGDAQGLAHFAAERKSEQRQTFGAFLVHDWRPNVATGPLGVVHDFAAHTRRED